MSKRPVKRNPELEDKLEELRAKRSRLDDIRYELDTERESLEALTREQRELEMEQDELPRRLLARLKNSTPKWSGSANGNKAIETEINEPGRHRIQRGNDRGWGVDTARRPGR